MLEDGTEKDDIAADLALIAAAQSRALRDLCLRDSRVHGGSNR